jgi:hypothetical protein
MPTSFLGPISDYLGLSNRSNIVQPTIDPNAFQYGGRAGGAANAQKRMEDFGYGAQGRQGVQIDNTLGGQDRASQQWGSDQQRSLAGNLQDIAAGRGMTAADAQLQRGTDAAIRSGMAVAHSAPGGLGAALANRNALQTTTDISQQGANAATQLRAQEAAQARGELAGVLQTNRGQDLGLMGQDYEQAYRQAQLEAEQRRLNDSTTLGSQGLSNQVGLGQLGAQGQQQGLNTQAGLATQSGNANINQKNAEANANMLSGIAGAGGALLAMSDVRRKTDIVPDSPAMAMSPAMYGMNLPGRPDEAQVLEAQRIASAPTAPSGFSGGLGSALTGFSKGFSGSFSDERLKNKDPYSAGESETDKFLASLHPYSYRYKNPGDEPTPAPTGSRYLGIMAQHLERSPTGDTMVKDTPRGKMVEEMPLVSAMAAGLGRIHERLRNLESSRVKSATA